jgi:hypothetical protein
MCGCSTKSYVKKQPMKKIEKTNKETNNINIKFQYSNKSSIKHQKSDNNGL